MQLPLLCDVGALVSAICAVSCSEKQSCSASAACDGCDCVRTWLEFSLSQGGGRRLPGATLSWELMISSEGGAPLPVLCLQAPVDDPLAFKLPPRCLHSGRRLLAPYSGRIMSPMDGNMRFCLMADGDWSWEAMLTSEGGECLPVLGVLARGDSRLAFSSPPHCLDRTWRAASE